MSPPPVIADIPVRLHQNADSAGKTPPLPVKHASTNDGPAQTARGPRVAR
jgi:hypothetical protein